MEAAKRESILSEACKVFAKLGFQKASVDDIARRAGVAKGTIYLAAPSKKDLFYEVLLREIRGWNATLQKRIDPRRPADQLLTELALSSLSTMDDRPLVRDLLMGEHHEVLPELKERLDELRRIGIQPIVEVLEIGIDQGVFRADLDVDEVARILLDLHTATVMFVVGRDRDPLRLARRSKSAFDLILRGLQSASPPTKKK
ncbi:MAG: TetR/AcrR family transcriptional regulator [Deltaproteobacteria bacterium]|nr:TetR/AcrR family transcriptional regulator [Deltaproteobacteria bacterium]